MIESYPMEGFVQCVMFSPRDKNIFVAGTSRNVLCVMDRRDPNVALTLRNDHMVNSLYVARYGLTVVSADAAGFIKTWDVRSGKCVVNEATKKPISHLTCFMAGIDEEPRYLAINSYDNVIRVYDRGYASPQGSYRLFQTLKGYKNKNWPIKSSFYNNKDGGLSARGSSAEDVFTKTDDPTEGIDGSAFDKEKPSQETLLATGSADPFVYVYSLGKSEVCIFYLLCF